MTGAGAAPVFPGGGPPPAPGTRPHALRLAFLRWQCRVRQIIMREDRGRPGPAIAPEVTPEGASAPLGRIITVLSKAPAFDRTPELAHIARRTHDPMLRREAAVRLLSESYFQRAEEFSDMLTATFPPASPGAAALVEAGRVRLDFAAWGQRFAIAARVRRLSDRDPAWAATFWHNLLFNPALPADTVILGFVPDWQRSAADPPPP
ncbi:MAG: hypothetical protein N2Z62_15235 [Rhodobacteraceae bacterium]|nr:hypothetical protein [Paracoccaceae bacterium]